MAEIGATPVKYAYLFSSEEFGVEPLLNILGIQDCKKVLPSKLKSAVNKILKGTPDETLLIVSDSNEDISLLEKLRFEKSVTSPVVILSFSEKSAVEKKLTVSPRTKQPILCFDQGMYYLKMPYSVESLRDILKVAVTIEEAEMDALKKEYEFAVRVKEDADFRHRCANLSSAIRILQGAYYVGDIRTDDYKAALESFRQLSWKTPDMRPYVKTIKDYIDSFTPINQSLQTTGEIISSAPTRVMLLDDETFTAGWDIVFKAISRKFNISMSFETDRERFLGDIEIKDNLNFDILLLDLKLPDAPGKSIYLMERMREKFPDITVVIFTALNTVRDFEKCKKAGAFEYFIKELGPEDRAPVAYYKKLKWIIGRAADLSREGTKIKDSAVMTGEPAFYTCKSRLPVSISTEEEKYFIIEEWDTFFAFSVATVGGATDQATAQIEEKRERIISWLLKEPSDGRQVSLRYITDPEQHSLTIAIIGKTKSSTGAKSLERARSMCRNLSLLLNDFSPYNFEPVIEQKNLFSILEPFQASDIVTIKREEIPVEIDGKKLIAVHPFSFNVKTYLDGYLKMALSHDTRTAVNVGLWPVAMARELDEHKRHLDRAKMQFTVSNPKKEAITYVEGHGQRVSSLLSVPRKDEPSASRTEGALSALEGQWKSLKGRCLFVRIDVLSESEIPSMITETLTYDFFGADARVQIISNKGKNLERAYSDVRLLNFAKPNRDGAIMANLVDLSQAKCVFQLPIPKKDDGVPGIRTESLNVIPAPMEITSDIPGEKGFLVANGFMKGGIVPLTLKPADLMKHLYICGRTGSGKSTLLLTLGKSLAEKGEGFCVIDPHGDISLTLKDLIPKTRKKDVIFIDPTDYTNAHVLNLLENDGGVSQQERILQEFMSMLFRLYPRDYMGPVFERCFRHTLFLAMMAGKALPDLSKIWNDEGFRQECLKKIDRASDIGKETVDFWEKEVPDIDRSKDWGGFRTFLVAKVGRFYQDEKIRNFLGSGKTTIDFDSIMNDSKILIVRMMKGDLGEINAFTLGSIIVFKLKEAAMRRGMISEDRRKEFYLLIDEFQNFVGSGGMAYSGEDVPFLSLVSEARKFKVSLILTNQFIYQLGAGMKSAIFGNIQSKILFGLGAEDAAYVKEQIPRGPLPEAYIDLPNYYAYAQLLSNGKQVGPFTIKTVLP